MPGEDDQDEIVRFLLARPAAGGEPVRIDTHGAVVVLSGRDVFKMKRAVRLPFMDLSSVEKRRRACVREVEVNAAFAPETYLGVVPVVRRADGSLALGGAGTVVEWLVHMRRFDESLTFDHLAEAGLLSSDRLRLTASAVAEAHARAPVLRSADFAGHLIGVIEENIDTLLASSGLADRHRIEMLGRASREAFELLETRLRLRARQGYVRRCHGDLHLRNIVLIDDKPTLFDALEFDEALATIDVLYDLAFLVMDLWHGGHSFEANHLLNRYLAEVRDEPGLPGLSAMPLFLAVRATIRAKVEGVRHDQTGDASFRAEAERYLLFAEEMLRPVPPRLVAIGGLSGTGKSSVASSIAPRLGRVPGAIHLRSDVERKSLLGAAEFDRLPEAAYDQATTEAVYAVLERKAATVLESGLAVVIDAVHQLESERKAVAALAVRHGVEFTGIWLDAPPATLQERVAGRHGDASDADAAVVAQQASRDSGPISWWRVDAARPLGDVTADVEALLARRAG